MKQIELLPCPFCGAIPIINKKDSSSMRSNCADGFDIECRTEECHMEFGADFYFDTELEAINSWNKRGNV